MNKCMVILALLAACGAVLADTAYMNPATIQVSWSRPDVVTDPATGQRYGYPSDETLTACGWTIAEYDACELQYRVVEWNPPSVRAMTQEEMDARAAAQAEAQAERDRQAALPTVYTNGVEVPWVVFLDATNRQRGIAMELTTNNVPIYYEFHASPVDWKKVDANRAVALSAAAAREKDSAEAVAYAKDKAAKDKASKAEAVAATSGGKEPSDKEKIALVWKHYLAVVGAEEK